MKKTIGIIGGMGPLATCDLYNKIIRVTDAKQDQDHVRVLIDSNPAIPDRTEAILHGGENPVPAIIRGAQGLEEMGADILLMPCNTSHYFYDKISSSVSIPLVNMLEETAKAAVEKHISCAGLVATDGVIQTGVYETAFKKAGIDLVIPTAYEQKAVMDLIYHGVKAGNYGIDTRGFLGVVDALMKRGAQTIILGCTELPVAYEKFHFSFPSIDPTLVIAAYAVKFSGAKMRESRCQNIF